MKLLRTATLTLLSLTMLGGAHGRQLVTPVWTAPTVSALPMGFGNKIAVDADGQFFASCSSGFGNGSSLGMYDRQGTQLWNQNYSSAFSVRTDLGSLAVDGEGGVYAGGYTTAASGFGGPPLGGTDGLLVRYGASGTPRWSLRVGGDGSDSISAVAEWPSGGCVVVGSTSSGAGFGSARYGNTDAFIARFDAAGNELWVRRFGQADHIETFRDVSIDAAGFIYCCGSTFDVITGFSSYGLVSKMTGDGASVFLRRGLGSMTVPGRCIPDGVGGMIVVGIDYFDTSVLARTHPNGLVLWEELLRTPSSALSFGSDLFSLESGGFAVAGHRRISGTEQSTVLVYSDAGVPLEESVLALGSNQRNSLRAVGDNGRGTMVAIAGAASGFAPYQPFLARLTFGGIGSAGCDGELNSTGSGALTQILGSAVRDDDTVTLFASGLPAQSAGYFLTSTTSGFVVGAGGSDGNLCLGGSVGRFNRAGEAQNSGAERRFHLDIGLGSMPSPMSSVAAVAGETWWFQAWYRDATPMPTSNFTSSVGVTWQ